VTLFTTGHPALGAHRETLGGVDVRYLSCPPGVYTPQWNAALERSLGELHGAAPFDLVHSHSTAALHVDLHRFSRPPRGVVTFYGEAIGELRTVARISLNPIHPRGTLLGARAIERMLRNDFLVQRLPRALRKWTVVATSPPMAERLRRWYRVPLDRLFFVPQAVDTNLYTPDGDSGREVGPLLLAAGRMEREKGFDLALEAHRRVLDRHPATRLLLAGDGGDRAELESLSSKLGTDGLVRFMGRLDSGALLSAYRAADVLLHMTRREEGIPNVALEAMACGTPVIGTPYGGMAHALAGGGGIVVRRPLVTSAASSVVRLLDDPGRLRDMGVAARAHAEREFASDVVARRTEEIYALAA
jgi:glycosyltransferase involved in cell wall biosynthesis